MAHELTIPRLGWSMEEATFVAWHRQPGDAVKAGQPLYALESDKATQDVEALDAGTLQLTPDAPKPGDTVRPGQRVGWLLGPGETVSDLEAAAKPSTRRESVPPVVEATAGSSDSREPGPGSATDATRRTSTPRARRVAAALSIDWTTVSGTGAGGRVRERDVRAHVSGGGARAGIRRRIAERMLASLRETAPVTLHRTVDATALVAWRERLRAELSGSGAAVPGYTDLLVHLAARALLANPLLNQRREGGEYRPMAGIHVGIAVDTEAGLLVPVVRSAAGLGVVALARVTRELIGRARAGQLTASELGGGTFTVTSLGGQGVEAFTPILNPPECAILGVGRIVRRPAVVGERIEARDQLTLSLTFDHAALDGAPAAAFLQTLARAIED